jgi:hypothetical protein
MMSITLSQTNRKIRISMVCSGPKNEADRREEEREYGAHSDTAHHIQLDEIVSPADEGSLLYVSSIEECKLDTIASCAPCSFVAVSD